LTVTNPRTNPVTTPSLARASRVAPWLFGVFALAALVVAVAHFGDLTRAVAMTRRAQPVWLLAVLLLQASTYASVALGWAAVLRRAGAPQPLRRLLPLAVSKLFADQVIPSAGMGGNVLLVDRLCALGTPRGAAVATLLVSMVGFYVAYAALALLMLFALWMQREASPVLVGLVTVFLLVAVAIPALALWLRHRGSIPLSSWIERLRPVRALLGVVGEAPGDLVSDRRLIASVAGFNALVFLADVATLAVCLRALGQPLLPATSFIALITASIVVTLGPIPMGLGSFEATCTAMLGMLGVPVAPALAATLLLRSATLWLPLVPGLILLRTGRTRSRRRDASRART
jgi:uncharacterized protein (TIRG00374 family)